MLASGEASAAMVQRKYRAQCLRGDQVRNSQIHPCNFVNLMYIFIIHK